MQENKTFFFYNFLFATFHRKPGIVISDLYLYSIKIEINIKQKIDRKICGKVTNCFWTWLDQAQGQSYPAQQIVEKLSIVHMNSEEEMDAGERE
jgi:hypothetical protein